MKIEATPWARDRLTAEDYGTLRVALPDEYRLYLSAKTPSGPYYATLSFRLSRRSPRETLGGSESRISPMTAADRVMADVTGEHDDDALGKQLAASLRARGLDPGLEEPAA